MVLPHSLGLSGPDISLQLGPCGPGSRFDSRARSRGSGSCSPAGLGTRCCSPRAMTFWLRMANAPMGRLTRVEAARTRPLAAVSAPPIRGAPGRGTAAPHAAVPSGWRNEPRASRRSAASLRVVQAQLLVLSLGNRKSAPRRIPQRAHCSAEA